MYFFFEQVNKNVECIVYYITNLAKYSLKKQLTLKMNISTKKMCDHCKKKHLKTEKKIYYQNKYLKYDVNPFLKIKMSYTCFKEYFLFLNVDWNWLTLKIISIELWSKEKLHRYFSLTKVVNNTFVSLMIPIKNLVGMKYFN